MENMQLSKNIIIIESPGKIKKFKECLGKEYEIISSLGHCVDLPIKKIGVDINNEFKPTWEIKTDRKEIVKEIQKKCKKADFVFLMTDGDREGEGIAYHIYDLIKDTCKGKIYRATTNQITKSGIQEAMANPGELDQPKINSYIARRLLDRIAGYRVSFLTKQATGGSSAGRVQSAVLRIIVDRENEILAFIPEEYWVLAARFLTKKNEEYDGTLTESIKVHNETEAVAIYNKCLESVPVIKSAESKEYITKPYPPFITMSMIASSASILGWAAEKTMNVAQDLYSAGNITYHRVDSPYMAPDGINAARQYIGSNYGDTYLPSNAVVYAAKAGSQEAHECCRPTDILAQLHLSGDNQKLYDLIWKRAVASQMNPGRDNRVKVITDLGGYDFVSNGKIEIFDGFRKCWNYSQSDDVVLPDLKDGEHVSLLNLSKNQKFTVPPSRYTDSSLAKFCEKKQITRPATIANVFKTLVTRQYTTRKKNTFYPTETGMSVVKFLKAADMCFVDVDFTQQLENKLDMIVDDKLNHVDVLNEFWTRLKGDIEKGKDIKNQSQITEFKCPLCHGALLAKHSHWGSFFACSNYKRPKTVKGKKVEQEGSCNYTAKKGEDGSPVEKTAAPPKEYASFPCSKCGAKMVKRTSKKFGTEFYGCEKFAQNGCKSIADMEGIFKEPKKKFYKKKKTDDE